MITPDAARGLRRLQRGIDVASSEEKNFWDGICASDEWPGTSSTDGVEASGLPTERVAKVRQPDRAVTGSLVGPANAPADAVDGYDGA
jgi:hypothetical protein